MARIRIIDEWLRCPISPPTRARMVMVVADTWSEQRVLMRAYASADDQTRPTIVLHGHELAMSPAGIDPHGSWGIHVDPPVDGRAQDLRSQLELAARRLAGSKGNPPRLIDEVPKFDEKATNLWAPGTPSDPERGRQGPAAPPAAEPVAHQQPQTAPVSGRRTYPGAGQGAARAPSSAHASRAGGASCEGGLSRVTPQPHVRQSRLQPAVSAPPAAALVEASGQRRGSTHRHAAVAPPPATGPRRAQPPSSDFHGGKTRPGFQSDEEVEAAPPRPSRPSRPPEPGPIGFASLVGRTMPVGLSLTDAERDVLNALGRADFLTASEIGSVAGVRDPVAWMEDLLQKLGTMGLDVIAPGPARGTEPSYRLRR